ncbi:MAG TPA: hypothetical protein VMV50_03620 [Candidatus Paceibacterota bacterium]|nr:hypothetical protein [Candidatus Paceibacterota bacterium]
MQKYENGVDYVEALKEAGIEVSRDAELVLRELAISRPGVPVELAIACASDFDIQGGSVGFKHLVQVAESKGLSRGVADNIAALLPAHVEELKRGLNPHMPLTFAASVRSFPQSVAFKVRCENGRIHLETCGGNPDYALAPTRKFLFEKRV